MSHHDAVDHLAKALLALDFADDPELDGTPRRVAEVLASFRGQTPLPSLTRTHTHSTTPVVVSGIPFHSMCVHHLLPFFGHVAVAYRPSEAVIGLGSIPRVVQHAARRLQLQERMADQIADHLFEATAAQALAVGIRARHMCVEMRGACSPADVTVLAVRGQDDPWLVQRVENPE